MSKLPKEHKFIDLSDYGRPVAKIIANSFRETKITPIHVTCFFIISGFIAIYFLFTGNYILTTIFLILKSILDAADGELARIKNKPSYTGRFFDSISDIILNFLILGVIVYTTDKNYFLGFIAFLGLQLQGTLYNYYYVILRNKLSGDTTSRIFEKNIPIALEGESQRNVTNLYKIYTILYGIFDWIIYKLDPRAPDQEKAFPKWFMTILSSFGLGFQLLLVGLFCLFGLKEFVVLFFIFYSILVPILILVRNQFFRN